MSEKYKQALPPKEISESSPSRDPTKSNLVEVASLKKVLERESLLRDKSQKTPLAKNNTPQPQDISISRILAKDFSAKNGNKGSVGIVGITEVDDRGKLNTSIGLGAKIEVKF